MDGSGNSRIGEAAAASGGAAGLAGAAAALALCCYGPWAVAIFGLSGAVAIARIEPFRPFILGAAAPLLLWAFWRVYRRPGRGVWIQIALWTALALLAASFFAPQLALLILGPEIQGANP